MIVRPATEDDRLPVLRLLKESHVASGVAWPFRGAYAEAQFRAHVADADACCFVLGDRPRGVLAARAFDHPLGAGTWAKESIWYIAPDGRGCGALRMLDAYEAWAREQGCTVIGMASLAVNDVSRLYARRGYEPVETHFIKAL